MSDEIEPAGAAMTRQERGRMGAEARWGNQRNAQREPQREDRLKRVQMGGDRFAVDESKRPDGMAYQWVAVSVMGQPDTRQSTAMMMNHWKAVPAARHREVAGMNARDDEAIVVDGLMLCERPAYLNEESRADEARAARAQVGDQMRRVNHAPAGTLSDNGRRPGGARRSYDSMVPEDAE